MHQVDRYVEPNGLLVLLVVGTNLPDVGQGFLYGVVDISHDRTPFGRYVADRLSGG